MRRHPNILQKKVPEVSGTVCKVKLPAKAEARMCLSSFFVRAVRQCPPPATPNYASVCRHPQDVTLAKCSAVASSTLQEPLDAASEVQQAPVVVVQLSTLVLSAALFLPVRLPCAL